MVSLSLHSLVFNALNHPDLELLPRPPTSADDLNLILSQLSDDLKLVVVVPLPQVMVFDSDDDDDVPDVPKTFIMPQMTVGGPHRYRIAIVTRSSHGRHFVDQVARHVAHADVDICHIDLRHLTNAADAYGADLLFLLNDGLAEFVEFIRQVRCSPKLTIINMMSVNYFVNLFDLIALMKPYQMWKALLLTHPELATKLLHFIDTEYSGHGHQLVVALAPALVYHLLITTSPQDYHQLEGQFKRDLTSLTLAIDPLQLLGKLTTVRWLYHALRRMWALELEMAPLRWWMVASFTVGIGLGVGLALGAALVVGYYLYLWLFGTEAVAPVAPPAPVVVDAAPPTATASHLKHLSAIVAEWVNSGWEKLLQVLMARV